MVGGTVKIIWHSTTPPDTSVQRLVEQEPLFSARTAGAQGSQWGHPQHGAKTCKRSFCQRTHPLTQKWLSICGLTLRISES